MSNTLQNIVLTMFWDARMDEQNKTIMPPATLRWAEAQNLTSTKNPSSV